MHVLWAKRLFLVMFLFVFSVLIFSFELSLGTMYSFSGNFVFTTEFTTLGISQNAPNTTSGFSTLFITDFGNYYLAFGGIAKYTVKLDFGTTALYGMGGMLAPLNGFGFDKITGIVRIGAKYYFENFSVNSGIFSYYLIDNTKVEGVEFSVGYSF
ncbi:MAG: hypothetical protein ACP5KD_07695 [Fervidobacterium sp.]